MHTTPYSALNNTVPFDNDTFGKCSISQQYCDLVQSQFHQTVFIGSGTCDKQEAMLVQNQVLDSGKCYDAPGQSVLVSCVAGSCPMMSSPTEEAMQQKVVSDMLMMTMLMREQDGEPPALIQ